MAGKQYPRVREKRQLKKVPLCVVCGAVATFQVVAQTTWTRGDDEITHICDLHKHQPPEKLLESLKAAKL